MRSRSWTVNGELETDFGDYRERKPFRGSGKCLKMTIEAKV
jgi:hypothetical protein